MPANLPQPRQPVFLNRFGFNLEVIQRAALRHRAPAPVDPRPRVVRKPRVSPAAGPALRYIRRHGPADYTRIARALRITRGASHMMLHRLAKAGRLIVVRKGKAGFRGWPTLFDIPRGGAQ